MEQCKHQTVSANLLKLGAWLMTQTRKVCIFLDDLFFVPSPIEAIIEKNKDLARQYISRV